MSDIKIEEKENRKILAVDRIVDLLYEQAYLSDIDIVENNYYDFFAILYDFFKEKNQIYFYFEIMECFITTAIAKMDKVNLKNLYDSLYILNKYIFKEKKSVVSKEELEILKEKLELPKTKLLLPIN